MKMEDIVDYVIEPKGMISGQGEAVVRRYYKFVGKSGRTWLVADQPDAASNIYVTNNAANTTERRGFQGFGGATLVMPLVEGGEFELHGGWHSNADALFEDTGEDVRDKHSTFVVVAKDRRLEDWRTILTDVVYQDAEWTLGRFDRGRAIAKRLQEELDCPLILYSESMGGSSCGPVQ